LLAPGFAFVNSFLDSFKGYMMMGWGRWMDGMILTLAPPILNHHKFRNRCLRNIKILTFKY
ncbi:hypothetical protein AS859_10940, partial [Aliarcobacter cryaerophilus]